MNKLTHTDATRRASLVHRTAPLARRAVRPIITLVVGLLLALFSAALTYSTPPALDGTSGAAFFIVQPTSSSQQKDLSEVGSTDGIVLMGFVIALIIIVPILWRRKSWMAPR